MVPMAKRVVMMVQASPVWQALIDDAEQRGLIVRDASAAELFPDMAELHLMQANRRPPTPEPQPLVLDRAPNEEIQGPTANTEGGTGAVVGVRGMPLRGRGAPHMGRGGRADHDGGHRGGRWGTHVGPSVVHGLPDNLQHDSAQSYSQVSRPMEALPRPLNDLVQFDSRQQQLTPAQLAIQQGKLQQQLERQQQQQADQHLPQQHSQMPPLQQQRLQYERQDYGQASGEMPCDALQRMQGTQHEQAYSSNTPRDPRQAYVCTPPDGRGAPSSSQAAHSQNPIWLHSQGPAADTPQHNLSAAAVAGISTQSGNFDTESSERAGHDHHLHTHSRDRALRGCLDPQDESHSRGLNGLHARQDSTVEMPAIPPRVAHPAWVSHSGAGSQHDAAQHRMRGAAQSPRHVSQHRDPALLDVVPVSRRTGHHYSAVSSDQQVPTPADPRKGLRNSLQEQGDDFAGPPVVQLGSSKHLGRYPLQHTAETPEVPLWTNNRR